MKGKALRRAITTADVLRVNADVPLIQDATELITPSSAQEMLRQNRHNRPINWRKVEEYSDLMRRGEWALTAQGIVIDTQGNILTGQKRLWAVIYADTNVYMRVSRGNPPATAKLLDRGTPQTARDLATRGTERKHSPTEASMARAYSAAMGNLKPSIDVLAVIIETYSDVATAILAETTGTKKGREFLMVAGAIYTVSGGADDASRLARKMPQLVETLAGRLLPHTAAQCWGRGAAFGLAMDVAKQIVEAA